MNNWSMELLFPHSAETPQSVHDIVTSYTDNIGEPPQQLAGEILSQGGPLANYAVLIPVAAHQEADSIYPALEQYNRQVTTQPFSVVLYMNHPVTVDQNAISASYQQLHQAVNDFPDLDIRYISQEYERPVIGAIRKDLWDATLLAGVNGGTITNSSDIICINHDIDLVKLPRSYIQTIQSHDAVSMKRRFSVSASVGHEDILMLGRVNSTRAKHAADPKWPNVAKATLWSDYLLDSHKAGFEASITIAASNYAFNNGFDPTKSSAEIIDFLNRDSRLQAKTLPGLPLETSPRRFVERLPTRHLDAVWGADPFQATETYRDTSITPPDISEERLFELVTRDATKQLGKYALSAGRQYFYDMSTEDKRLSNMLTRFMASDETTNDLALQRETVRRGSEPMINTADFILSRVIRLPDASTIIDGARGYVKDATTKR